MVNQIMEKREGVTAWKGVLYLLILLFYHFLEFFLTMAMGIGVGILASVIHYNFWYKELDPFWQTYVTLIFVFLVTELYFRMVSGTTFTNWINKTQNDYRLILFYIPRGLYLILYILTVSSLFIQYRSVHQERYIFNATNSTGMPTPKSPLSLELDDDHYLRTILFVISLAFMVFVMTKQSDWMTHRLQVMATGDEDPIAKGSIGSVIVLTGTHLFLTGIYILPIVGFIFIFKTFEAGWEETYFIIAFLSCMLGIFASILERQSLFPTTPMLPPNYAYENHLRIRVSFLQYWLIPLAAGRYFNRMKAVPGKMDATDGDFLVFTLEVAIGVLQATKVIANDIYILWIAPAPREPQEEVSTQVPEHELLEVNSAEIGPDELDFQGFPQSAGSDNELDSGPISIVSIVPSRHNTSGPNSVSELNNEDDKASVHELMKRIV